MGTTTENPFGAMPDWWVTSTVAGGAITGQTGKDATLARNGAGDYTVTLGSNGTNSENCSVGVDISATAGLFIRVVHTSNTAKQILLTDSANNPAEPTRMSIGIRRLV